MKIKRIMSYVLVIAMLFSCINLSVFAAAGSSAKYEIAVAVDPSNTSINLDTFENDLKSKMVALQPSLANSEIAISYVQPNSIKVTDPDVWNIYDHYYSKAYEQSSKTHADKSTLLSLANRTGQPFYYYKEGQTASSNFYTSPDEGRNAIHPRDKHIYNEGSRVTFMGYSVPAYKDFMLYPDENSGKKTIEYSIYLDSVSNHTLAGAGFLVNSKITGSGASAVINGYLVYYNYSNFSKTTLTGDTVHLYKLTNVNVDTLHGDGLGIGGTGFTQVVGSTTPKVTGKKVKDITLEVSRSGIKFYEKDGTVSNSTFSEVFSYSIPSINVSTNYGFGPLAAYTSHSCTELTIYTYDNITLTSNSTKKFDDKILEPKWKDGAVHALINVDNSGIINFTDNNTRTEMLQRLIDRDVHYIGWGKSSTTEEIKFINENNGNGFHIDTDVSLDNVTYSDISKPKETAADYDAQVEAIARYLVALTAPSVDRAPIAKIAYADDKLSSVSTDPNGGVLTEHWSIKEANEANWTVAANADAASTTLAAILLDPNKNVLVQLIVEDEDGNFSEPDVLYLSNQLTVKPIANFSIDESIDIETSTSAKVKPVNTSFDPYVDGRAMTYKWEVYNEMNKLVLSSTDFEPEFDFEGKPAGRYDVKLTASAPGPIQSGTFVQAISIIDTIAPKLLVDLKGSKNNATATIQIVDYGSGPDSYRVRTTDNSNVQITGPWIPAQAPLSISKTYAFVPTALKSLEFEVKDGSGNTASYPVDFNIPMIAYTPNGGNIYTNFIYDEDVRVDISSLTDATVSDWYYQWLPLATYPVDKDITVEGIHVTGSAVASIPQPNQIGSYYLHVKAFNSEGKSNSAVSERFNVAVAQNGVQDFRIIATSASGITFSWTLPKDATAQKILYSDDNGVTWKQATHATLSGSDNTAVVTGLSLSNDYIFKLKVDGGEDAGESNLVYWKDLVKYASGDSSISVTKNVTLITSAGIGTTVTWSSDNTSLADRIGNIFRPSYTEGNKNVTLTATISNGATTYTILFILTVIAEAPTDEETVTHDKANLAIIYADGDHAAHVTKNVTLSAITIPSLGSTVTWTSSNTGHVTTGGAITRPANGSGDVIVYLTATITKNSEAETKVFKLTVKEEAQTDRQALDELEIVYAPLDHSGHVTQNVGLPAAASNGVPVIWTSNNQDVITGGGTVTRPANTSGDTIVTLTAAVGAETRTFALTVLEMTPDDAGAVAADKAQLKIIYATGDSESSVTQSVTLLTALSNGSAVVWSSDKPAVIGSDGIVVRPAFGSGNDTVTLTADISKNGVTTSAIYVLTVIETPENTDAQDIQADLDDISIVYQAGDAADHVTKNVGLPLTGTKGSDISWTSSDSLLLDKEGNVYRPSDRTGDSTVTLTATVSKGTATPITKTFTLLVKALGSNDESVLIQDKNLLNIGFTGGDADSSVTQNITLPVLGANGSTISWSSDNPGAVTTGGVITRPAAGSSDVTVRLTATLTYNGITETKVFEITIKAHDQIPSSNPSNTEALPTGVDILVNGKIETAGTARLSNNGNRKAITITVDPKKLEDRLEREGNNALVTIPVKTDAEIIVGELTGDMIKNMEIKQASLEVKTGTASYTIPAHQINIDAISAQFGSNIELKDIKVSIEISNSTKDTVKVAENSAEKGKFTIIAPVMDFTVKYTNGNKTVEADRFDIYVQRTIAIPTGVDPNKITTGVVVDPDGTSRHVPTRVTIENRIYYAVINSLTNSTYTVVWHPLEFDDAEKHWAKNAINDMGSRMVVTGVGNNLYEPNRDVTRAEFAAIIVKALGLKPGIGANPFSDVKNTAWYADYIKTATDYKIITGYGNGKFGPMDNITREQAMTMIGKAMNITGLKVQLSTEQIGELLSGFGDGSKAAGYAKNSIAACIKSGIISGRNGKLIAPKDYITRAEVAVVVRNLLIKSDLI